MKIQVAIAQTIFDLFKNGSIGLSSNSGEEWKRGSESFTGKFSGGYVSDPIELPTPFNYAQMTFRKFGDFYELAMVFVKRHSDLFTNISSDLSEDFAEIGYEFLPTTPHGTGYVVDNKRVPILGIKGRGENDLLRELSLGSNGSCPRKFGEYTDFASDIGLIQRAGNVYLDSILRNHKQVPNRELFKNLNLYINL